MCDNYHRHGRVLGTTAARVHYWNKCCRRCPRSFCSGATKTESEWAELPKNSIKEREVRPWELCPSPLNASTSHQAQRSQQHFLLRRAAHRAGSQRSRPLSAARSCTHRGSGTAQEREQERAGPGRGGRAAGQGEAALGSAPRGCRVPRCPTPRAGHWAAPAEPGREPEHSQSSSPPRALKQKYVWVVNAKLFPMYLSCQQDSELYRFSLPQQGMQQHHFCFPWII